MTPPASPGGGRFVKGRSGNLAGHPRKPPAPAGPAIAVLIDRTLTVTRGGQAREVTMEEALQHRTYQDAIAGKRLAQRAVLLWIARREAWLAAQGARTPRRVIPIIGAHQPTNANAALQILGIASIDARWLREVPDQVRLLLEPWAVQAALARRRSATPLKERDITEIKRCTREAESLRWPKETQR